MTPESPRPLARVDSASIRHDGEAWGPAALEERARLAAAALQDAGVAPAEPVTLWSPNLPALVVALLAVRRVGACAVLLHPRLAPAEAHTLVRRVGARLVWAHPSLAATLPEAQALPPMTTSPRLRPLTGPPPHIEADFVVFTSGTIGRPKGVVLAEDALRLHARLSAERIQAGPRSRWLATLPLAHVGGLAMLARCLEHGATLVLPPARLPHDLDGLVHEDAVTHLSLVPTQFERWLRARRPRGPPPTLECVLLGGAPIPPDLVGRARAAGFPVRATYGLSEAASQVATATRDAPAGSCGPPLPGVAVEPRDEGGRRTKVGREGELWVRSPTVMRGYHGDAALAARVLVGGWLRTGDRGRLDAQGLLWVTGRVDDLIITGGENVDPLEVEGILEAHPAVAEAGVVGVPDAAWGQRVVAAVVRRAGVAVAPAELEARCRAAVAGFKVPKEIVFVEALPRTGSGKLRRGALRVRLSVGGDADVRVDDPVR